VESAILLEAMLLWHSCEIDTPTEAKTAKLMSSVWLYQGLFLDNHRHHRPVAHIKEIIDEGRWRIAA
jgi:hypothetical protein